MSHFDMMTELTVLTVVIVKTENLKSMNISVTDNLKARELAHLKKNDYHCEPFYEILSHIYFF